MISFTVPSSSASRSRNFNNFAVKSSRSPKRPCLIAALPRLLAEGKLKEAVESLDLLRQRGLRLDSRTIALLLQHCSKTRSIKYGKWVHLYLKLTGLKKPTTFLCNHLIDMYLKCGDHVQAQKLFDKMSLKNLYSWNNMLSGYAKLGMIKPAKELFDRMPGKDVMSWNSMVIAYAKANFFEEAIRHYCSFRQSSVQLNAFSFAGVLTVCVRSRDVRLTRQVHCQVFVSGYLSNVVLSSSAVDAYTKCGYVSDARRLFDEMEVKDILSWTTLISGYTRCGDMDSATELFDQMPEKNQVSWTALVSGYVRNGMCHEALELFTRMMMLSVRPDQFTLSSSLCACASLASLKHGKQIHGFLLRCSIIPNAIVVSSLIDMYSKCGNVSGGRWIFDKLGNKKDPILWNTLISALAHHGRGEEAINMFCDLLKSDAKPNRITFIVVLRTCCHSGFVDEGINIFKSMTLSHGILPDEEHYTCLVDLLGRAGHLEDLLCHLHPMRSKHVDEAGSAPLGVCNIHQNLQLGKTSAEHDVNVDPHSAGAHVFFSNICAILGKWDDVETMRNERDVSKQRAVSWIEVENKVHSFSISDRVHPMQEIIHSTLKRLAVQIERQSLFKLED